MELNSAAPAHLETLSDAKVKIPFISQIDFSFKKKKKNVKSLKEWWKLISLWEIIIIQDTTFN